MVALGTAQWLGRIPVLSVTTAVTTGKRLDVNHCKLCHLEARCHNVWMFTFWNCQSIKITLEHGCFPDNYLLKPETQFELKLGAGGEKGVGGQPALCWEWLSHQL